MSVLYRIYLFGCFLYLVGVINVIYRSIKAVETHLTEKNKDSLQEQDKNIASYLIDVLKILCVGLLPVFNLWFGLILIFYSHEVVNLVCQKVLEELNDNSNK